MKQFWHFHICGGPKIRLAADLSLNRLETCHLITIGILVAAIHAFCHQICLSENKNVVSLHPRQKAVILSRQCYFTDIADLSTLK